MLKDTGGLLTPDRIRTLIPALSEVIGKRSLEVHTHNLTGLAPLVCLEAVELRADALHTSIAPLASGNGQTSTQGIVRDLRTLGTRSTSTKTAPPRSAIGSARSPKRRTSAWGADRVKRHALHAPDARGMLSNFKSQLETTGLADRFDELLHEVARCGRNSPTPS
ncbi:hypothetical protein [Arthrobacter sulfonylureivorans]|uniref:Pyruvate carboxyltransferase domain-containing protein n=1 Tax=Arthrobacter sulfonylureivorans TaxID=2486855 RepID=A0ABY3WE49_9MICC|nr:hypothetical protein [Arthrobacter sulfonylureivorans]UNK47756.1 hypothetical protein MNQ99_18710 [Arthrobacter sulfonylureivorans]